ncbi:type I glyceraldehyde-3-phosphate dehydrogenase, partial [Patescibacteria group bacterium]|nr:type I glyceraldehyde-3-phosphate dehydrogenase [Patescibacteria group bacterium]
FHKKVKAGKDEITAGSQKISVFSSDNPSDIPWEKEKIDIVIDATGKFRTSHELEGHLKGSVKYAVLSAPAKDDTKTLVMGVNQQLFNPTTDKVISNSSCTTNCLSNTLKVIDDNFAVTRGFMTTVHAITDSQNLLDNSHKKEVRLRRSAFASMIPASTGSAKDIGKLFPSLKGKIICQAIRLPLLTVSIINLTVQTEKSCDIEMVNKAFREASQNDLKGVVEVAEEELVSRDFTGNSHSAIIDPFLTKVNGGNLVNVYAWYDNEWGYTTRLVDMVTYVGRKAGII